MFRISPVNPVLVSVSVLTLALFSSHFVIVSAIPAPVIKKDAARFDPQPIEFDHFDLGHFTQDPHPQSQIHPSIDPIHHEESSPKSVRSISSATGLTGNVNTIANNNAETPAGTALLQALTAIQAAADNSGVHLNSDPNSEQSSVADVQKQIKKLKEQVELYQMINDMLKAETMVQKEPEATTVSSIPPPVAPTPTTDSTRNLELHGASLAKPEEVEVTTPQPRSRPQPQPKRTRTRQNTPQKQVVPIIPRTVAPQVVHHDLEENNHGHDGERQLHRDYGHDNHYHNHPEYNHDHEEHNRDHQRNPENHHGPDVDYDQYNNNHGQYRQQPQHQHYDDYDQDHFRNPMPPRPQLTQSPQVQGRPSQNRGQRKFKRNN